jgi:pyruvate dehydrogenase E2 component (dihydrolipoamide acetyltransferase)
MKVDIVMPKMGESISEGTLIKWHKKEGDPVKKDEIIYEISTDKVDTEIPSPEDGVLVDIKVNEQETVEVGTVVAVIETNGESAKEMKENGKKEEQLSTEQSVDGLIDVPMPKMGESITEGTILKWHKQVGDHVNRDETIFEISTDKVDTEVPSPVDGTIAEILYAENETVGVGIAVARISASEGFVKQKSSDEVNDQEQDYEQEHEVKMKLSAQSGKIKDNSSLFYSPLVLNIARVEGVSMSELETIVATGAGGRLTKNDLLKYIANRKRSTDLKSRLHRKEEEEIIPGKSGKVTPAPNQRTEIIPMDNIRLRIMNHMIDSRNTSVHVTAVVEVDMSRIHHFIEKNREIFAKKEGLKLTYMSFISFAIIKALKEFPMMNASIDGNNIVIKKYINLGIAVAVEPNGLIVPNVKNADEKNLRGLSKAIADLGSRARTKKLVADDVVDGTFTITNYGVFGSLFGTPIINQPEVGILGVGAVTKKPVVVENDGVESIAIKPMMYLSLSHDHRLVDGMLGGKFMKSIKETLENFDTSLV